MKDTVVVEVFAHLRKENEMDSKIEKELLFLEDIKLAAHTIIHRMTLWQFITRGGWWRKQYDSACEQIVKINKEQNRKE